MVRHIAFISICLLFSLPGFAQSSYAVQIAPGKKIIHVDQFDLPASTSLSTILNMFPELLARDGKDQLNNYDIQVNDVSMGVAKENVIEQFMLGDVKEIEVSQNPSTSAQKNGQGGVINIKLKNMKEGASGHAFFGVSTITKVKPGVRINYKKGAWQMRGGLMMQYAHPFGEMKRRETVLPTVSTFQSDTSKVNDFSQIFTFDATYQPNKADNLRMWVSQSYSYDNERNATGINRNSVLKSNSSRQIEKNLTVLAGVKYAHTFSRAKLQGEATFERAPSNFSLLKYDENNGKSFNWWTLYSNSARTKLTGQAKCTFFLIPQGQSSKAELLTGVNCNYEPRTTLDYDFSSIPQNNMLSGSIQDANLNSNNSTIYLSPFIESNNQFGKWFLKGGLRYQYYRTTFDVNDLDRVTLPENHLTAFANIGYQIAPHHHISMILDRSIRRADNSKVFPSLIYNPIQENFILGNPDLLSTSYHNVSLDYITDFTKGDNYYTFNTGIKYINSNRLITSEHHPEYITYINDGLGNTAVINFLFLFSKDIFSMSFSANAFNTFKETSGNIDSYKYFNLSLMPSLSFERGWNLSGQIAYNSKVVKENSTMGSYLYVWTRLSKIFGNVTAYLQLDDCMHRTVEDKFFGKAISESLLYNLRTSNIKIGADISF